MFVSFSKTAGFPQECMVLHSAFFQRVNVYTLRHSRGCLHGHAVIVSTRIDGWLLLEAAVFFRYSAGERTTTLTTEFQQMIGRRVLGHFCLVDDNALYFDNFHKRLRER